jgi:hypothetical protein
VLSFLTYHLEFYFQNSFSKFSKKLKKKVQKFWYFFFFLKILKNRIDKLKKNSCPVNYSRKYSIFWNRFLNLVHCGTFWCRASRSKCKITISSAHKWCVKRLWKSKHCYILKCILNSDSKWKPQIQKCY